MKIMGIDYGDARTGVAISDLLCSIVGSTAVVPSRNREKLMADILRLIQDNGVGEVVVGLPKNMDGSEGFRVDATHEFADALKTIYDGEIVFWDERLSSVGAARFLNETNTRGKKRKDVLDTVAACIILDGYISSQKNK